MLPSIELSWKSGQHFAFRWKFSAKKPYLCLRGRGALWLYYFWNIYRCGKERRETTIPGNKYFRFYYFSWSNKIWMCSLSMSLFVWFKRIKMIWKLQEQTNNIFGSGYLGVFWQTNNNYVICDVTMFINLIIPSVTVRDSHLSWFCSSSQSPEWTPDGVSVQCTSRAESTSQ